jgi:hypothetical protein
MTNVRDQRCQGITAAGVQCKCWARLRINDVPYCLQHGERELRALAINKASRMGESETGKGGGEG